MSVVRASSHWLQFVVVRRHTALSGDEKLGVVIICKTSRSEWAPKELYDK